MVEKRVKFTIDKSGNYKIETLKGFSETGCHDVVNVLAAAIGGSAGDGGDKDSYERDSSAEVAGFTI